MPRKVKAAEAKYRDRAAERLAGVNDYADVRGANCEVRLSTY